MLGRRVYGFRGQVKLVVVLCSLAGKVDLLSKLDGKGQCTYGLLASCKLVGTLIQ